MDRSRIATARNSSPSGRTWSWKISCERQPLAAGDASVDARTDALAEWCQGYILGLLHSDKLSVDQLPEDGPEIARDIMSISQAGRSEEAAEKDEWALAELQEYVKVGVQLIFEFIYQSRAAKQPQAPEQ